MAVAEIGEINLSKSQDCTSSSSSVIEVGYGLTMNEEDMPDLSSARIFRVPKPLRDSNDSWYSPQFVSIGPFHYGKEELKEMEKSKSEAVRRMQKRIQTQRMDAQASIKSIVENNIVLKEKEIREFYGEHIPYGSEELVWMVTRDACFLFEFLVKYIKNEADPPPVCKEEVSKFSWKLDSVFDSNNVSPMREKIMDDLLLVENQIPLWILKELLHIKIGSTEGANESLKVLTLWMMKRSHNFFFFMWYLYPSSDHISSHLLEEFYLRTVGSDVEDYFVAEAETLLPLPGNRMQSWFKKLSLPGKHMQLWLKKQLGSSNANPAELVQFVKLPSAVELTRAGVKISAVLAEDAITSEPGSSAIQWIRFDEKTSTLYLPQIIVTPHSSSVMRSIIAMEMGPTERYAPMPITMFSIFLDELIDNEEDVAVLRKAEVIKGYLGSNQQVADLFDSLAEGIPYNPGCNVIDDVRSGLHNYTRRKYKILWSKFVNSKPWLVAASAGTLLLLMTVIQVFCLFFTCNV